MGIFDFLTSILTGGATGLLGMIFTAVSRWAEARQRMAERAQDYKHELALQQLAMQTRGMELESEQAIADIEATQAMRTGSYDHDRGYGRASQWVVNILRLVRPALTLGLIVLTGLIYFSLDNASQRQDVIEMVSYATTAAIVWWFGAREMERRK
ncbi:hypothetical protein [Oceanibaculum indicum]|uniref:Uncharacterized protein n=1 Tax=Oceanibaculum indicum P24 TaxID=1207063 RepID=K2JPP6_9PROT|nr:hypothetical protein [Oceanibaculum indicum]EKE72474.1 hypothetical protein P24_13743 [Oceanibaculum indicum P24]